VVENKRWNVVAGYLSLAPPAAPGPPDPKQRAHLVAVGEHAVCESEWIMLDPAPCYLPPPAASSIAAIEAAAETEVGPAGTAVDPATKDWRSWVPGAGKDGMPPPAEPALSPLSSLRASVGAALGCEAGAVHVWTVVLVGEEPPHSHYGEAPVLHVPRYTDIEAKSLPPLPRDRPRRSLVVRDGNLIEIFSRQETDQALHQALLREGEVGPGRVAPGVGDYLSRRGSGWLAD